MFSSPLLGKAPLDERLTGECSGRDWSASILDGATVGEIRCRWQVRFERWLLVCGQQTLMPGDWQSSLLEDVLASEGEVDAMPVAAAIS